MIQEESRRKVSLRLLIITKVINQPVIRSSSVNLLSAKRLSKRLNRSKPIS